MSRKYDVAAYIWPAYTGDEPRTRMFWREGIGEWQSVKNSAPKSNGYFWNRHPLWGYQNEADPKVMQEQIEAAVSHGVNVFIYYNVSCMRTSAPIGQKTASRTL